VLLRVDESEDLSKKKGEEINTIKKEKETIESSLSYNTLETLEEAKVEFDKLKLESQKIQEALKCRKVCKLLSLVYSGN
jgi:IMP dehydrogenase/GMP reductase